MGTSILKNGLLHFMHNKKSMSLMRRQNPNQSQRNTDYFASLVMTNGKNRHCEDEVRSNLKKEKDYFTSLVMTNGKNRHCEETKSTKQSQERKGLLHFARNDKSIRLLQVLIHLNKAIPSVVHPVKNIFIVLIFVSFALLASCSSDPKTNSGQTAGTPVKVASPSTALMTDYMSFNANTVFMKKEIVRSTFQGFIQKVYKNIGDYVNAGDVVFQIITKEAFASDSLRVKLSDEVFSGVVNIKSKTSGILTELNYNVGDFVSDGEQLAVISNPHSLAVLLNVPYQHISKIRLKSSCILVFPNGKQINGIISKSLPSVDPVSQTQTFLIDFGDGKEIPANLNLEVKIPVNIKKDAVVLPKSAIQTDETLTEFWIMKLLNDTTAIKTAITKGIENDSLVQIINPKLSLIEKVIVDGAYGLPDTAKVVIR